MFFDLFSLFPTYFRYVAELEKSIVSVERIREYQSTPQEAAFNLPDIDPEPSWPLRGEIIFQDYATRYRDGNEYLPGMLCNGNGAISHLQTEMRIVEDFRYSFYNW